MCLYEIKEQHLNLEGVGYKVMRMRPDGTVRPAIMSKFHTPRRRWLNADGHFIHAIKGKYPAGFHIYTQKSYALKVCGCFSVVVRVKYRKGHTIGYQSSDYHGPYATRLKNLRSRTVVADEMLIEDIIHKGKCV